MKDKIRRIIAVAGLLAIFACLIVTLIFAFTGNPKFMGMLLITLLMPILLWICLFFYKQGKDRLK